MKIVLLRTVGVTFELPLSFQSLVFVALPFPPRLHVVFVIHVRVPVVLLTLPLIWPFRVFRFLRVLYAVAPPINE